MTYDFTLHPSLAEPNDALSAFIESDDSPHSLNYDADLGVYRGDDFALAVCEPGGTVYGATPKFAKEAKGAADRAYLREVLPYPSGGTFGDADRPRIYTDLRWRSTSGMSRSIGVLIPYQDERTGALGIRNISRVAARILGWKLDDDREAVRVGGAGMDMGFHLVYELSRQVYKADWSCTNAKALEAAHNGDPGYVVQHEWL